MEDEQKTVAKDRLQEALTLKSEREKNKNLEGHVEQLKQEAARKAAEEKQMKTDLDAATAEARKYKGVAIQCGTLGDAFEDIKQETMSHFLHKFSDRIQAIELTHPLLDYTT